MITDFITNRPSPNLASIQNYYGRFKYKDLPNGQIQIDPNWVAKNITFIPIRDLPNFPLYPAPQGLQRVSGIRVHKLVKPVLLETWEEVCQRGLSKKLHTFNGLFTPRHMLHDRMKPISRHSWGIAVDFDQQWNGYDIPHSRMQIDRDVVRVFEEYGWAWGGRWANSDGMHFEYLDQQAGVPVPFWQDIADDATVPEHHTLFFNGTAMPNKMIRLSDLGTINNLQPNKTFIVLPESVQIAPSRDNGGHRVYLNSVDISGNRIEARDLVINAVHANKTFIVQRSLL